LRRDLIGMGYSEEAVDQMMNHEESDRPSSAPAQGCVGAL